ncbi:non-ribosomal peptide synthetase [Streptomyces marincola]|uniref:non-ribosomal peptide synthetase n=1 Tax=Streptomyces marincola TaxID=2878388 RepID=UPI001CF559DE|nr:non-ribosomal peptide synthetase [Streptomyces marincola]UCM87044.1 amino acid adenylation domain-containing protein [Streptomyces marincola]
MSEATRPDGTETGAWEDTDVLAAVAAAVDLPPEEIGADTDLFELGLDSLALIRLAADWRRRGLRVGFEELAGEPTLAHWRRLLTAARAAAPGEEGDAARTGAAATGAAEPGAGDDAFPLAVMQHAYWIGRQDDQPLGGVGAHFYAELDGTSVDPGRLGRAVRQLRQRHETLRITVLDDGRQRVLEEPARRDVTVHDFTALPADEAAKALLRLRDQYTHRRMDVERGEVFDVALSLLPGGATRLHIDLDMVAADAASMRVLLRDLRHLYARPDEPLPPIRESYRAHLPAARADRAADRAAARDWWRERLHTLPPPPRLPTVIDPLDPGSSDARYHRTTRLHHHLTAERTRVLHERARRHRLTPTAVLTAVFAEVLAAWSAEPRFLLNIPLFQRDLGRPGADLLVGDFSSSVLLDVDLTEERPFAEVARHVQDGLRATIARGAYSGVEVLRDLARAAGGTPVLAPVVYTSALGLGEIYDGGVRETFGEPSWIISQGPQVWLDAQVTEFDGGLLLNWDVREALFEAGVPAAAFGAYRGLIETLLDDEDAWARPVGPQLPAAQRENRDRVNATDAPLPTGLLHEGFHRAALRAPGGTALVDVTGRPVTYGELADRAGRVTALLNRAGVRPGDSVAVRLPRGAGQVAAVLGVLGAGATYVPVGVGQPAERAARIVRGASAVAVLTDEKRAAAAGPAPRVLTLEAAEGLDPAPPLLDQPLDTVAYTLFTSGSTGRPKGVDVSHGAAVQTITALGERYGTGPADRGLALAELDFDMSVYDLFAPLSAGGSAVLIDEESRRDAEHWCRLVREHGVTFVNCVPALLDMLLTAAEAHPAGLGDTLRLVLLGGDWVGLDQPGRLRALAPAARCVALGGMTEAAVHSTVFDIDEVDPAWTSIPWGVPLPNVRARVVDTRGRDCPDQVAGELWIGGAALAEGYRGDPGRTADRFVRHEGRRWYRTGDRARYRPDGTLQFLGRADHQVKLRGHRIELGEVEAAAASRPDVSACVALVTGTPARLALVAAGGPEGPPSEAALRETLTGLLPAYMVPARLVLVDALPLTLNGKPDRARAAALAGAGEAAGERRAEAPAGWAETVLAEAWSELLGVRDVGRHDDFFALGGDSLLATRLIAALRARGAGGARVARLFAAPRLADFAADLVREQAAVAALGTGDPARAHEPFPPTDVQRAFWIGRDDRLPLGGVGTWHYSEFDGEDVDLGRVERAWRLLIDRHDMLRAVLDEDGRQRVLPGVPPFTVHVTEVATEAEAPAALERLRAACSHRALDLTTWPLFDIRAVRYPRAGCTRTRLALGLDYIVLDGASIMILHSELDTLYRDPDAQLPPIDVSFRDYVLGAVPDADAVERARAYWLRRLDDLPPAPELPLAGDPAALARPRFTRRDRPLPADRWEILRDRARRHGLTPSAVLLLAYVEVLAAWSDQDGVTVNLTLFNRQPVHPHIDRVVGDFTSVSLIGHRPRPGENWLDAAHRLQRVMGEDLDHREASAIWLMQELARRTGTVEAAMPVVFSSTVGVGDRAAKDRSAAFPAKVFGLTQTPQVMLDNQVTESRGGVMVSWDAIEDLFRPGVLDAMFDTYCRTLDALAGPEWAEGPLPLAPPAVPHPAGHRPGGPAGLLHGDLLRQAADRPERPALLWPGGSLTHGLLAERAARVAAGLAAHGVRPGDVVALRLPHGPDQVVAALGALRAGAAYVAAGADGEAAPGAAERPRAAGAVLAVAAEADPAAGPRAVALRDLLASPLPAGPLPGDPGGRPDPDAPAVLGAAPAPGRAPHALSHRAAHSALADLRARYAVGERDRVLSLAGPDSARWTFDVFAVLGAGGALVLPTADGPDRSGEPGRSAEPGRSGEPDRSAEPGRSGEPDRSADPEPGPDPGVWVRLAAEHGVTVWNGTPAQLDLFLAACASRPGGAPLPAGLRLALVSEDRVGRDLPGRLRALAGRDCRFVTLGAVPGSPVWAGAAETGAEPDPEPGATPAPGADAPRPADAAGARFLPLAGQRYRVADPAGRDRPAWVAGELWLGGPESAAPPDATGWYRTGVRARHREDGTLDLLGPEDRSVRVGGRRVALDEVEAAVESHPGVARAAVAALGPAGDLRLHAVVVPAGGEPADLAAHVAGLLSPHATPTRFAFTDRLPLTPEGRVDLAAVAALAEAAAGAAGPPSGAVERRVAALWAGHVGAEPGDRHANFFAEGGDSLAALRLVGAVNEEFGTDVPVRAFLAAPTPADLAARVEAAHSTRTTEESGVI